VFYSGQNRGFFVDIQNTKPAVLNGGDEEVLRGDELVLGGWVVMSISLKEVICAFVSQALNLT